MKRNGGHLCVGVFPSWRLLLEPHDTSHRVLYATFRVVFGVGVGVCVCVSIAEDVEPESSDLSETVPMKRMSCGG